jgi:putative membrane protein
MSCWRDAVGIGCTHPSRALSQRERFMTSTTRHQSNPMPPSGGAMSRPPQLTVLAASVLLLGLAGSCIATQSADTSAKTMQANTAAAARPAHPMKATDSTFMKHAAADGMAEVAMGRMALDKSSDSQVKQLAQRIVDDHTKANDQLKTIAQDKNVTLPDGPAPDARKSADAMQKMDGAAFDKAWAKHMVTDHKKAIAMFTKASKGGDADVRGFATETLPTLRTHLKMAEDLAGSTGDHTGRKSGATPPPVDNPVPGASASNPAAAPDHKQ